jgi:amino acid transporter
VKYFGISEFYMSIFKIFLMLGLMMYTFVTMVGGNPDRDPYGFRYWRDPVRRSCGPIMLDFHPNAVDN